MDAIDLEVGNRPKKRGGKEIIRMGRNIHNDMKQPAAQFPKRFFENQPKQAKNQKEHYQAVAQIV